MHIALLSLLAACSPDSRSVEADVTASATEVPSVLRLEWHVFGATDCWVTWQDIAGIGHETDGNQLAPEHWEALLVGAASDVLSYQIWADGELLDSGDAATEESTFPVDVTSAQGRFASPTATTMQIGMEWFPVVLDENGQPRWWLEPQQQDWISLRVRPDDRGLWVSRFSIDPEQYAGSRIELIGWDGVLLETVEAPGHHHDFWVHDDGTLVWLAFEAFQRGPRSSFGETLWRLVPGGEPEPFFSLADAFPELRDVDWEEQEYWAWANHLDFDGTHYWVSLHDRDVYLRIAEDGDVSGILGEWDLLGARPDWVADEPFLAQHGGSVTPDGTFLVHDNQGGPDSVRVLELSLDDASGTAEAVWSYDPPEPWSSPALGDVIRDGDGNTRISWGLFGTMEELDADDQPAARLELEESSFLGFLTPLEPLD